MNLSHPPPHDVVWRFHHLFTGQFVDVTARTWFAARTLAMSMLGAGPDEVVGEVRGG